MATNDFQNVNLSGGSGSGGSSIPNLTTLEPLGGGADDAPQISSALHDAKTAGGGTVLLSNGTYSIQSDISPTGQDYMCGVHLVGQGEDTILSVDSGITVAAIKLAGNSIAATKVVNNVTAGDATITMTTHSDAGLFVPGDIIAIKGTDSESVVDIETRHEITAANATSGVVTLREPIFKTLTTVTIADFWGSDDNTYSAMNNSIENMQIKLNYSPGAAIDGILAVDQKDFVVKDVMFRGWTSNFATNGNAPLVIQQSLNAKVSNVQIEGSKNQGILLQQSYLSSIKDCVVDNCMTSTSSAMPIDLNSSFECLVENNLINRGLGTGGGIGISGSNIARRNKIINNRIIKTVSYGVKLTNAKNTLVKDNHFEATADAAVYIDGPRNIVEGNSMHKCQLAGQFVAANGSYSSFNGNVISQSVSYGVFGSANTVGAIISNNIFNTGGGNDPCISPTTMSSACISGNVISSWTGKGIYLQGSCVDNLVNGNMIFSTSSDGIKLDDGCTNNMISMNHMRGLTLTQGAGAGNDFISNKVA